MDHPLRELGPLGRTALYPRDFELQWDPQRSREGVAGVPLALREAESDEEGARRRIGVGGYRKAEEGPHRTRGDGSEQHVFQRGGRGARGVTSKVDNPAKNKAC